MTSGIIGANEDKVIAGGTSAGDGQHRLGERYTDVDGNVHVYVQASGAITPAAEAVAVAIDEDYQATELTTALALAGHRVGWAPQQTIIDDDCFWARISGVFPIRVAANCAADIQLYTTATAGILDDASGTGSLARIDGVVLTVAAGTSSSSGNGLEIDAIVASGGAFVVAV